MQTEYAIYLRKSRADLEAEATGAGDTLARHEQILMGLAKSRALPIGAIYREIVSGERIANRPVMQQLLTEVEEGRWKGVLVTETSRLARGDTIDQGIVAQAFKISHTLIVTPQKDFDPNNEIDEEWFEFGLFMSRQEYRMIRRRQLAGTRAAKREGRYVPSRPPFGYERYKLEGRGWSLKPVEPEAGIIRLIYAKYESGTSIPDIARELEQAKIRTPLNKAWTRATVRAILLNPHYAGYIPSAMHINQKIVHKGELITIRPRNEKCELYEGLHEAIIPREEWNRVQELMKKNITPRVRSEFRLLNPFAGLLFCDKCGQPLKRQRGAANERPRMYCATKGCPTVASPIVLIEDLVLKSLGELLKKIEMNAPVLPTTKSDEEALLNIEKQLAEIDRRLKRTFEFLEDGVYDKETFLRRQSDINSERTELLEAKAEVRKRIDEKETAIEAQRSAAPRIKSVLEVYERMEDPEDKNKLLKQVIERIDYHKTVRLYCKKPSDFSITIHPKIFTP